jgi:hypothetical protein
MGNDPINSFDPDGGENKDWYRNEKTNKAEWHDENPGAGFEWLGDADYVFEQGLLPSFQITDKEYLAREYGSLGVWFTRENSSRYNHTLPSAEELETAAKIQVGLVGAVVGAGALIELAPSAMAAVSQAYWNAGAAYNAINVVVTQGARNLALRLATAARPTLLAPAVGTTAWKVGSKIYVELIHFSGKGSVDVYELGTKIYDAYNNVTDIVDGLTQD